jgi:RHS repeat-associated protein
MTSWNGNVYHREDLGLIWRHEAAGFAYIHLYTADDERIWTFHEGHNRSRWVVRDLDGKLLREFDNNWGTWTVVRDYVYRDGVPLAAVAPAGVRHLHPDHLGTPRLITQGTTQFGPIQIAFHAHYPYGVEATAFNQDDERMKFTGHERDLGVKTSAADDVDYMHARYYNPQVGRFLRVDPVLSSFDPRKPQSANRYAYVLNNPLVFIDPSGELWFKIGGSWDYQSGVQSITKYTLQEDGSYKKETIQGTPTLATFDGATLKLFQQDGSTKSFTAVSGEVSSAGKTQPALQGVKDVGPLPEGEYSLDPSQIQIISTKDLLLGLVGRGAWPGGKASWGEQRAWLAPAPGTDTKGRSGFSIHGGARPGSAGCIDLCSQAKDFFSSVDRTVDKIPVFVDY